MDATRKDIDRFWAKVTKAGPDDCWLFTGALDQDGYGTFWINGGTRRAPRVAWVITHDEAIPDGQVVRHRCDNRPCVNPAHLMLGTNADNSADMVERDRAARGDRNGSRLYPERLPRGEEHPRYRTGGPCPNGHPEERCYRVASTGERKCRDCVNALQRAQRAALRGTPEWEERKRRRNARERTWYAARKSAQ